jgi:hypothetical protein
MRFIGFMNNALGVLVFVTCSVFAVFSGGYHEIIEQREAAYYAQLQLIANQSIESLSHISTRDL